MKSVPGSGFLDRGRYRRWSSSIRASACVTSIFRRVSSGMSSRLKAFAIGVPLMDRAFQIVMPNRFIVWMESVLVSVTPS